MFVTVTFAPLCNSFPFHNWVTFCPFANVQVSAQLEIATGVVDA